MESLPRSPCATSPVSNGEVPAQSRRVGSYFINGNQHQTMLEQTLSQGLQRTGLRISEASNLTHSGE